MKKPASTAELSRAKQWLKQQKSIAGRSITASIVTSILAGFCLIAQTAALAYLVNQVVFLDQQWLDHTLALSVLLVLILIRILFVKYTEQLAFKGATKIKLSLRNSLYDKLITLGPSYVSEQQSPQLAQLLQQGVEELEAYYARYLPAVAFCAIIPLSILAVVLPIDWLTGLIFLVTAPLVPMFMILIGLKAESLNQKHWQQLNRMSNHFLDVIQGLAQLKLFNASRAEAQAIADIADKYRRSTMGILKIAFLSSFALEFLATLSIALVAVIVGFRLFWGELDFAIGFMMLLLAPEFYLPFRNLGTQYHAKMKGVAAAQQMLEILNATPAHSGQGKAKLNANNQLSIRFNDVSFNYPNKEAAISGINLTIDGPGLYGVIGPSGAGKSTLIDLLLAFLQPQHGHISINQQSLTDIDKKHWHQHLAWVPQNPQLIYGSIRDNIQLGDVNASTEQVLAAAQQSGVDQFVNDFDDGWQHLITEHGSGISGGQKQRIAMARALLKQADILVLDEPSAHLDNETEQWLNQSIAQYAKDHIVIVIAHRLHTVKDAKTILLLNDGQLWAQGTHQQLLASSDLYAQLIAANGDLSQQILAAAGNNQVNLNKLDVDCTHTTGRNTNHSEAKDA